MRGLKRRAGAEGVRVLGAGEEPEAKKAKDDEDDS